VVVDVDVIDFFVLNRRLFSVVNCLQLMAIGQIGMMSCRDDIVLIVSGGGQALMLGGGFEMVRGRAVMLCGAVVNFVFVCSRHREDPNFEWNDSKIPERSRTRSIPIRAKTLPQSSDHYTTASINTLMTGIGINPAFHDVEGALRRNRWAARKI
jgi:hypothetical protein